MVQWAAPAALALLVMLPRLASPQFGLLDDGLTLETGREMTGRWSGVLALIPETGRFFPAYWLVYSAVFALVGARPLAFFVVNVAVLAGLLAILARLVRLSGGTSREALVTAVVFAACGPAVEAFYTLSKAEPLQMVWIGVALLATAAAVGDSRWGRRAAFGVLAASTSLLAFATKETNVALIPIASGWIAIELLSSGTRRQAARFAITFAVIYVVAAGPSSPAPRWVGSRARAPGLCRASRGAWRSRRSRRAGFCGWRRSSMPPRTGACSSRWIARIRPSSISWRGSHAGTASS